MDGSKKPTVALTDQERFPLIQDLSFLSKVRQDEFAPRFNFQSGDRLQRHHLQAVHAYASRIRNSKSFWSKDQQPDWLDTFFLTCTQKVPFYQNRNGRFNDQPTIRRSDLRARPWEFVSSDCDLNDLLVYQTSGTTGPPLDVIFDPVSQACWLPQLESVLDPLGVAIPRGSDRVALAFVCAQQETLTYASLSTYLQGAGIVKINLHESQWRDPSFACRFLEKYNPPILTGDPFSFYALMELKAAIRPLVLVSSAMKLTAQLKTQFENHFQCPVLDIYSLTECRMIAVAADENRYRAIRPDLFLEVFDKDADRVVPYGERGELVVSGGNNPFLPLIRYRTGDFCSMEIVDGTPYLLDLEAREPIMFFNAKNRFINHVDISRAMTRYPLSGFTLHQHADMHLTMRCWTADPSIRQQVANALVQIFGSGIRIDIVIEAPARANGAKAVNYSSDIQMVE